MRAFLTGGTGFIGGRVARALISRGWDVVALVRSPERAGALRELGVTLVGGDITEPTTLTPMRRCDAVFHLAAWWAIGASDRQRMYTVNVAGTENVLAEAADAGIARVVYCSSVAAIGSGKSGEIRDETARHSGAFSSIYEETKWQAHRAAHDFAADGVPVVTVMPCAVYGPGDVSIVGMMWRYYARGWLVAFPALDSSLSWVHVDDVAEGVVLAHDKGRAGEDYLLGGDNATIGEMLTRISPHTGVRPPRFELPERLLRLSRPLGPAVSRMMRQEPRFIEESIANLRTYLMVSSAKAERELGYSWRSIEDGIPPTVEWFRTH
jgi:nucleoside-diphosphate-sugar epimerase